MSKMNVDMYKFNKDIEGLNELERQYNKEIDNEINEDKEIAEKTDFLSQELLKKPYVGATIDGREFKISLKIQKKLVEKTDIKTEKKVKVMTDHVLIVAIDLNKYKLVGARRYIPYMFCAEMRKFYDFKGNVAAVVETMIRTIMGKIKAEEI